MLNPCTFMTPDFSLSNTGPVNRIAVGLPVMIPEFSIVPRFVKVPIVRVTPDPIFSVVSTGNWSGFGRVHVLVFAFHVPPNGGFGHTVEPFEVFRLIVLPLDRAKEKRERAGRRIRTESTTKIILSEGLE